MSVIKCDENILSEYIRLAKRPKRPSIDWSKLCTSTEVNLHQISPYIGKLKSIIAGELIDRYCPQKGRILDPFAGSGTIPLEASIRGCTAYAFDSNPYAAVLNLAKSAPPRTEVAALKSLDRIFKAVETRNLPRVTEAPKWVRAFFHPQTLREILRLSQYLKSNSHHFEFACLLGILHHQRPGFLSFPSSHLVPYLRTNKFPQREFPEMYEYRSIESRLIAKVKRTLKRIRPGTASFTFKQGGVETLNFPRDLDAVITSPPYMNALDYRRDNRLRLWFVDHDEAESQDDNRADNFESIMSAFARKSFSSIKDGGKCIIIVGHDVRRSGSKLPAQRTCEIFSRSAPGFELTEVIEDSIPDIRRARRDCIGTKKEHILIFRKCTK